MLDLTLRQTKEQGLQSICPLIPPSIHPTHLTLLGFLFGLLSCTSAASSHSTLSLSAWLLNRLLDSLDGSLARSRNQVSEVGGFVDLLCDFIIYSLLPIAVGYGEELRRGVGCDWRAIAWLEASFHVNNFVLLYVAAVEGKMGNRPGNRDGDGDAHGHGHGHGHAHAHEAYDELTGLAMRPALVEGVESAVLFTLMLVFPGYLEALAWGMGAAVSIGVLQRVCYVVPVLGR